MGEANKQIAVMFPEHKPQTTTLVGKINADLRLGNEQFRAHKLHRITNWRQTFNSETWDFDVLDV